MAGGGIDGTLADMKPAASPGTNREGGRRGSASVGDKRGADTDDATGDGDGTSPGVGSVQGSAAKKKKTAQGSRGVANLTPEQLAKKRANDREAQRAIRERTKNQIDGLERRIEELTNQKPYLELQAAVRAKEAVERENAEIKRQLASVIAILKPIAESDTGTKVPQSQPQSHLQSLRPDRSPADQPTPSQTDSPQTNLEQQQHQASPGWHDTQQQRNFDSRKDPSLEHLSNQKLQLRQGLSIAGERAGFNVLVKPGQLVSRVQAGPNGAQDSPEHRHVPLKHDWAASHNEQQETLRRSSGQAWNSPGEASVEDNYTRPASLGPSNSTGSSTPPQHIHSYHLQNHHHNHNQQASPKPNTESSLAHYAHPIRNCEPTCPLDVLLLNFMSERRQRAAEGFSMHEVIGPRYPSVSSLLNPSNSVYSHPLSKLFTDVLIAFPDISRLPERVAVLYIMFLVMRWQISPTRENYDRLPEWMTPRKSQLEHAHPAWIDHVPFPAMRERLAQHYNPHEYALDNFFIPYTTTLRLNWPYEETDALLLLPDSDEMIINPVFERHLRNNDNWTLGERFARAFPSLADTFNLDKEDGSGSTPGTTATSASPMTR